MWNRCRYCEVTASYNKQGIWPGKRTQVEHSNTNKEDIYGSPG